MEKAYTVKSTSCSTYLVYHSILRCGNTTRLYSRLGTASLLLMLLMLANGLYVLLLK